MAGVGLLPRQGSVWHWTKMVLVPHNRLAVSLWVGNDHCAHSGARPHLDEPFTSSHMKWGQRTREFAQNIYEKTSYMVSYLVSEPSCRGDVRLLSSLLSRSCSLPSRIPHSLAGAPWTLLPPHGAQKSRWTTAKPPGPLRSLPAHTPTNVSRAIRHHVLVAI